MVPMKFVLYSLLWLALVFPSVGWAQKSNKQTDPYTQPFANPVDDPALPRVLIIGDSISIGYTPRVRTLLKGRANVHRPTTNCRWSAFGAEYIGEWLGEGDWDVIHFNFGLWDWYGWSQEVKATPESYAESLDSIVRQMKDKCPEAKLIFAITTPPCVEGEKKVKIVVTEQRAKAFNKAAREVMTEHGVGINDLYGAIGDQRAKYQKGPDDVHYTDPGRDLLAAKVAARISLDLPETTSSP